MSNTKHFFLAVYTHQVKKYCDVEFFNKLGQLTYPYKSLYVADNTEEFSYHNRLQIILDKEVHYKKTLYNLKVPKDGNWIKEKFIRRVAFSSDFLRRRFLKTAYDYFVIIESDVIVPPNLLELFLEVVDKADIIGGLYYAGFHNPEWFDINHQEFIPIPSGDTTILSGCTLYSRRLLEQVEFKYDPNTLVAFPDAIITHDARKLGYMTGNYTKIKCEHRHDSTGQRGLQFI